MVGICTFCREDRGLSFCREDRGLSFCREDRGLSPPDCFSALDHKMSPTLAIVLDVMNSPCFKFLMPIYYLCDYTYNNNNNSRNGSFFTWLATSSRKGADGL